MVEKREKELFIDLISSVKDVEESVKNCIEHTKETKTKYRSQILYLCYASLADCRESITELDGYIGEFDKKSLYEDILISGKTLKTLDMIEERIKTIDNLLSIELDEALNGMFEGLKDMF